MSAHTPGPWDHRQEYGGSRMDEIGIKGRDGKPTRVLCTVFVRKQIGVLRDEQRIVDDPEGMANARLIASAPDMAAELTRLRSLNAELVNELREVTMLFQTALLCTSVEVARDGMVIVKRARALLTKAQEKV